MWNEHGSFPKFGIFNVVFLVRRYSALHSKLHMGNKDGIPTLPDLVKLVLMKAVRSRRLRQGREAREVSIPT